MNPNKQKAIYLHKQMLRTSYVPYGGLCKTIEFKIGRSFAYEFEELCRPISAYPINLFWGSGYEVSESFGVYTKERQRLFIHWIENSKLLNDDTQTASH